MTTKKNPGLGARMGTINAAIAAADTSPDAETAESSRLVGVGIRMPSAVHEDLRRIAYEQRISINALLVEGAQMVVTARLKGK